MTHGYSGNWSGSLSDIPLRGSAQDDAAAWR